LWHGDRAAAPPLPDTPGSSQRILLLDDLARYAARRPCQGLPDLATPPQFGCRPDKTGHLIKAVTTPENYELTHRWKRLSDPGPSGCPAQVQDNYVPRLLSKYSIAVTHAYVANATLSP